MYTIFINDIPIFLIDSRNNIEKNLLFEFKKYSIENILIKAKSMELNKIFLYHSDIKMLWKEFKNHFNSDNYRYERAAGGLVKNSREEILFIYRLGKWDLPKGKIEKGESKKEAAKREVMEECGIENIIIEKKLQNTYHIFERKGRGTLKITHWYLMKTDYQGILTPQLEEDITEVVFKNREETKKALENTYGNIKLLFQKLDE